MDTAAAPMVSAPLSTAVRGTWPSYLGGGRLRTEKWRDPFMREQNNNRAGMVVFAML